MTNSTKGVKGRFHKARLNHNPFGKIDSNFLSQTDEKNAPFNKLDVEKSLTDETNLESFFAC